MTAAFDVAAGTDDHHHMASIQSTKNVMGSLLNMAAGTAGSAAQGTTRYFAAGAREPAGAAERAAACEALVVAGAGAIRAAQNGMEFIRWRVQQGSL